MPDLIKTQREILAMSLEARDQEVLGYQINIDNYRLAIADIEASGDTDLSDFAEQLRGLLKSELLEQKKAKVMRRVIAQQLEQ